MLKSKLGVFLLLIVFIISLDAKSLLYKVSSKTSTVYILGSIHLAKPEIYPLNQKITDAFEKSDILVVELDPESPEATTEILKAVQTKGMYPAGKSLKTELTAKTYKVLENYTKNGSMPLDMMQQMKPWIVMLQLTVAEMMRLGYSPEYGIDKNFLDSAKLYGKPVYELETAKEQMGLLSKDDKDFQDKLLLYTLDSMKELEPMLGKMFIAWKKGDAEFFDKLMQMPADVDPSLNGILYELITKRNYKMTDKILQYLKTNKDYFVVVGSGHVVGKEGIVDLLEKKGYRVSQK